MNLHPHFDTMLKFTDPEMYYALLNAGLSELDIDIMEKVTDDMHMEDMSREGKTWTPKYSEKILREEQAKEGYFPKRRMEVVVDNPVTGLYKPEVVSLRQIEWLMDYKRRKIEEGRIDKRTLLTELHELAKLKKRRLDEKRNIY